MMEDIHKKVVTGMLILMWVGMGLYMEIGGPTMIDLRIKLASSSEDIARCVSAQGIGIFLGALISGALVDRFGEWKILLVTTAGILSSVSVIMLSFVNNLTLLWLTFFFLGTSSGMTNVAGQRILLEMWKEKAPSPMHAMHMGFGIGALAAPLIANPFLAVIDFDETLSSSFNQTTVLQTTDTTSFPFVIVEESRVHLAYVTIGLITSVFSLPFFIYPAVKLCKRKKGSGYSNMDLNSQESTPGNKKLGWIDLINPASYADGSFKYGLFVFIVVFFYFLNLVGAEQLFGNFLRTFSVDQLKFPRNEASYLDTVYWGSFTLGRLTGSILAGFVGIRTLFLIDMTLNLLSAILANIFAAKTKSALWAFAAVVGLFIGPLFPAGLSYANTQIEVGGVVLTLVVFAVGFGDLLYVWIEGALYDGYGPQTILYAMLMSAVLVSVIVIVFVIVSCQRKDRFQRATERLITDIGDFADTVRYTEVDKNTSQS